MAPASLLVMDTKTFNPSGGGPPPGTDDPKTRVERLQQEIARIRDEARLNIHLARRDVQDTFARLEGRWSETNQELSRISRLQAEKARESADLMREGLEVLRESYRDLLKRI